MTQVLFVAALADLHLVTPMESWRPHLGEILDPPLGVPCFGLLVMSSLGFKAKLDCFICTWWRCMCYMSLRFTSCVISVELLVASMVAELFSSMYCSCKQALVGLESSINHADVASQCETRQTLYRLSYTSWAFMYTSCFITCFRRGNRKDMIIATKVRWNPAGGLTGDPRNPNTAGLSRKAVLDQVEASLTRLQTDYIDLYQVMMRTIAFRRDKCQETADSLN